MKKIVSALIREWKIRRQISPFELSLAAIALQTVQSLAARGLNLPLPLALPGDDDVLFPPGREAANLVSAFRRSVTAAAHRHMALNVESLGRLMEEANRVRKEAIDFYDLEA